MPLGLERRHNLGHLHFITFSCHHRLPYLETPKTKEILERVIERTRRSHDFLLYAYVLMPEHLHLLLREPKNHSGVEAYGCTLNSTRTGGAVAQN